jgi:TolB-like protein/Tfp pilus assembly protein PilF
MKRRLKTVVQELRQRSVFRAGVTYAVAAWLLLQIADVTFDRLPIPEGAMTALIVLIIIGFPVTLILAWGFEITVQGVVRHEDTDGGAPRIALAKFLSLLAAVILASGSLFYYLKLEHWEPPRRTIAVLPFNNATGEQGNEYFSDGLTEEIQSLIVRLNEFRVVAISSTYALKDTDLDVVSVARRLGADVVLQGSVRRFEDNLSVTARLYDGKDGRELWSESYDRDLSDIFAINEDIARQVARSLHVVLPVAAQRRLKRLGTRNVESYDLYLRGLDYLRKPPDENNLAMALEFLQQSTALDPQFVNAHAAICETHITSYNLSHASISFGEAEQACQRALEFDSDFIDVHLALGALYRTSGKYEVALREYETVLAANPNLADAYIGLGRTQAELGRNAAAEVNLRHAIEADVSYWASFSAMGRFLFSNSRFLEAAEFYQMYISRADDDATAFSNLGAAYYLAGDFAQAAKAWDSSIEIKPTHTAYSNTGSMYFYLGEFQKAAERYNEAVSLMPRDHVLWGNLGDSYFYTEILKDAAKVSYARAIEICEQELEINPLDTDTLSDLAYYHSRGGQVAKSKELNAVALAAAPGNMYVHYNSALIHAYLGETVEALRALERAVELEYQTDLLSFDPGFRGLVEEERFRTLISKNDQ